MASRTREIAWFGHMNQLRRHVHSCNKCKGAIAAKYPENLCMTGILLTASAAKEFDAVLSIKRQAHKDPDGFVYACPDVSKHGEAYALSAQPLTVVGRQETLF